MAAGAVLLATGLAAIVLSQPDDSPAPSAPPVVAEVRTSAAPPTTLEYFGAPAD